MHFRPYRALARARFGLCHMVVMAIAVWPPERCIARGSGDFGLHGWTARSSHGGGKARRQDVPGVWEQRAFPATLPDHFAGPVNFVRRLRGLKENLCRPRFCMYRIVSCRVGWSCGVSG